MMDLALAGFVLWVLVLCGLVYLVVDADLTAKIRSRLTGLPARIASCRFCSAGWLSTPASVAVALLWLVPWPWVLVYGAVMVLPPAGIGLMALLSAMSPSNAVAAWFKEMERRRGDE